MRALRSRAYLMIIGIAGYQNSGKTRLVELIVPRIVAAGFTVATVKHIAHDDLSVDAAGTDTFRHKRAGARLAVAASDTETVYFHSKGQTLEEVLERLEKIEPADLVIVEGFKGSRLPKIVIGEVQHGGQELHRWDGTEGGAEAIAESLMQGIRAERGGVKRSRAPGPTRRRPLARQRRADRGRRGAPR